MKKIACIINNNKNRTLIEQGADLQTKIITMISAQEKPTKYQLILWTLSVMMND